MKKHAILILGLLIMTTIVAAPGKEPSHPLSHIHPIDEDFNMSNMRIFNVSRVSVNGGLKLDGNQILDSGAMPILNYNDDDRRLELRNNDFGVTGNNITAANNISFNDSLKVWGGKVWIPEDNKYGYFYRKNLSEVLEDGNNATVYDINMNGNDIENIDELRTDGSVSDEIAVRDTSNDQDIARFNEGGEVEVPNGALDMSDNELQNVLNIKSTANNDLRIGAGAGGSDQVRIRDNANGQDIAVFEEGTQNVYIPNGNLDVLGNNITNIDWLKFEEGTSIDGNLTVNGSVNSSGDIDMNDNNIYDANSVEANRIYDPEDEALLVDDNVDLNENELQNVDGIQDGTGTNTVKLDGSNNVDVPNGNLKVSSSGAQIQVGDFGTQKIMDDGDRIRVQGQNGFSIGSYHGGSYQVVARGTQGVLTVPNGNLRLQGNRITDSTASDTVYVGDANSNTVQIQAGGSGDVALNTGDGGSGSTRRVTITSSGGEADVDVQNSDVDLNGNSVTTSTGEVCIGDQCA